MVTTFFAYLRVSTLKQGSGVSLQEQRLAIERYAELHQLTIGTWFEETRTAAKRGRAEFNRMLGLARQRRVRGVILHKIDRGARNLRDWADLGELLDSGIEIRVAGDGLDLSSRSGRLAADIQAVVAADYVRNLKEEARKGVLGRLRQGLYPYTAPLGYVNRGSGKVKSVDPGRAALIILAFELYATGDFTLSSLEERMSQEGLLISNDQATKSEILALLCKGWVYDGNWLTLDLGSTPFPQSRFDENLCADRQPLSQA